MKLKKIHTQILPLPFTVCIRVPTTVNAAGCIGYTISCSLSHAVFYYLEHRKLLQICTLLILRSKLNFNTVWLLAVQTQH